MDYNQSRSIPEGEMTPFFHAVSEAFQEAAHNSACMAQTMVGFKGTAPALPLERLVEVVRAHGLFGGGFPG